MPTLAMHLAQTFPPSFGSWSLAFGLPSGMEWVILLGLGLLIFGRRLPEVGRSLGRSIVEFKKGIKGIEDEIDQEAERPSSRRLADEPPRQSLPRTPRQEPAESEEQPYASAPERRVES